MIGGYDNTYKSLLEFYRERPLTITLGVRASVMVIKMATTLRLAYDFGARATLGLLTIRSIQQFDAICFWEDSSKVEALIAMAEDQNSDIAVLRFVFESFGS